MIVAFVSFDENFSSLFVVKFSFIERIFTRTMDKKTLEFVTYCIGKLSALLNLPQQERYRRLKSSGILHDYIIPS